MSEDRVFLLDRDTRSHPYPLQSFHTDANLEGNNVPPHNRSSRHVNFNIYDEVHSFHEREEYQPPTQLDLWTTVLMCCLLVLGVGCGIAHHAFNSYLDGRATSSFDQAWAIRIGTALAMAVKTALLASMGMAFAQRVWRSVRQNTMTVKALDSLFGAFSGDPRSLFQGDLYRSARLALLLAVVGWLLPIATVFTPATLRIKPMTRSSSRSCIVSTMNLNNITDGGLLRYPPTNASRLYTGPAPAVQRLALQSLLTGTAARATYLSDPVIGINTTHTVSFTAAALQCSENNATQPNPTNLTQYTYWQGTLSQTHDSGSNQDVPTLQIQYTSTPRTSAPLVISCVPWIAEYTALVSQNSTDETFIWTNKSWTRPAGRPVGGSAMQLTSESALDTGVAALIDATFGVLVGNLTEDQGGNLLPTTSKIALASFARTTNQSMFDFSQVAKSVDDLIWNVVVGAVGLGITQTNGTCDVTDQVNVYVYDQGVLLGAYLAVLGVAMAALGVGLHALKKNGHSGDTSFSGVILSTRNPTLDQACEGGRQELLATRIRFGFLRANDRPAFGTADDF